MCLFLVLIFHLYDAKIWLTPKSWSIYRFSKIWFVTSLGCWFSIWIPHLMQNVDRRQKSKLKMAAVRLLGFFKIWFPTKGLGYFFTGVPNLVQNVDRCRNYGEKSKFKMAAIRHLGFSKTWFLSNGSTRAGDFPSLYEIWCKNVDRRWNYGQKSKFKMAAVCHLGILLSPYRTTHVVFSLGYTSLSNFVLIRYTVLKIWRFDFIAELAWNK